MLDYGRGNLSGSDSTINGICDRYAASCPHCDLRLVRRPYMACMRLVRRTMRLFKHMHAIGLAESPQKQPPNGPHCDWKERPFRNHRSGRTHSLVQPSFWFVLPSSHSSAP